jgi:hypothetical protein
MRGTTMCLALLAGASVAGCEQATNPAGPSSLGRTPALAVESNERIPVSGIAYSDCGNENIAVTGVFHPVNAVTFDASGGYHLVFHYNLDAKGISQMTGAQYVVQTRASVELNFPATSLGQQFNRTDLFTLIGQGAAPNEVLTARIHFTVDANGIVRSSLDQFRLKC